MCKESSVLFTEVSWFWFSKFRRLQPSSLKILDKIYGTSISGYIYVTLLNSNRDDHTTVATQPILLSHVLIIIQPLTQDHPSRERVCLRTFHLRLHKT